MNDNQTIQRQQQAEFSKVTEDESSRDDSHTHAQKMVTGINSLDKKIQITTGRSESEQKEVMPMYELTDKVYARDEFGDIYPSIIKQMKTVRQESHDISWKYLVHFNGWNSRHDRWLLEKDILPDSKASQKMAEESKRKAKESERKRKEKKTMMELEKRRKLEKRQNSIPGKKSGNMKGKRKRDCFQPSRELIQEQFTLPFSLKTILVDEQSELSRFPLPKRGEPIVRQVHDLPSSISVERILKQFAKHQNKQKRKTSVTIRDAPVIPGVQRDTETKYKTFINDLMNLFDYVLPKFLLYNFERGQYLKFYNAEELGLEKKEQELCGRAGVKSASAIYSGEFLLRMLARLPHLLSAIETLSSDLHIQGGELASKVPAHASIMGQWKREYEKECGNLARLIGELIVFLQKIRDKIFKGNYKYVEV